MALKGPNPSNPWSSEGETMGQTKCISGPEGAEFDFLFILNVHESNDTNNRR